jgi:hypothetical protein
MGIFAVVVEIENRAKGIVQGSPIRVSIESEPVVLADGLRSYSAAIGTDNTHTVQQRRIR